MAGSTKIVPVRGVNTANGGGGGDMDTLTGRVEELEKDTHQIKIDLAVLTTRSENFATRTGLSDLKADVHQSLAGLHKEISAQTKWIVGAEIAVAAACMTAAKLFF